MILKMVIKIEDYLQDPAQFKARLQAVPSCEHIRFEISQNVTRSDFEEIALSFDRFLDLSIVLNDLTDHRWNLDFISFFLAVRALQIKCLWSLESLDSIAKLQNLEELELGSILNRTRDLSPILALPKIKSLSLSGDWNALWTLEALKTVESLAFIGSSEKNMTWIAGLSHLRELSMMDGRVENFDGWSSDTIKKITLLKMRHLRDLRGLGNFTQLQELTLKSLPRLEHLPSQEFLNQLQVFRAVHIRNAGVQESIDQVRDAALYFAFE